MTQTSGSGDIARYGNGPDGWMLVARRIMGCCDCIGLSRWSVGQLLPRLWAMSMSSSSWSLVLRCLEKRPENLELFNFQIGLCMETIVNARQVLTVGAFIRDAECKRKCSEVAFLVRNSKI